MPNVVVRNFFRLLRAGAFDQKEAVEPMSPWKWGRLYQIAVMHGVAGLVADGIDKLSDDFFLQLTPQATEKWQKTLQRIENDNEQTNAAVAALFDELKRLHLQPILLKGQAVAAFYPRPLHRTSGDIDIFFPDAEQAVAAEQWANENGEPPEEPERGHTTYTWHNVDVEHYAQMTTLTNPRLNRKLQAIIEEELSERLAQLPTISIGGANIETLPPTLAMLFILLRIMRYTLNEGASLKQIADLGIYLQRRQNRIDFAKLTDWLQQLEMQRMAQLEGSLLVRLFDFSADEIPFMDGQPPAEIDKVVSDLFTINNDHHDDWYFTQGRNIFVKTNNSSAMMWHVKHSFRYFKYYPSETATNFFISFSRSLSHIEE